MNDLFQVEELKPKVGAKIKVIGVGGGGCNMINHMINENVTGIELVVANTDGQALDGSMAPVKVQLGAKLTRGLGAGMKPEIGKAAAEESYQELKSILEGADMVFVAAGLGGGTGTGAAEVVSQAAKEIGALTVAVVTKPFIFEGQKRRKFADEGLAGIKKICDSIVVIPNDKLLAIVDKNMGIKDSFKIVDNVLSRAVTGISGVILKHGVTDINLDFADLKTVMSHRGTALMGVGESSGNDAAYQAMKNAIESPLFDNISISGAMGVLVHFNLHPNYPLVQIQQAMSIVFESASPDAEVIFGTTTDESIDIDKVIITIVATGFEKEAANAVVERSQVSAPQQQEKPQARAIRKISGGYDITFDEDELQVPTYLRRQMD